MAFAAETVPRSSSALARREPPPDRRRGDHDCRPKTFHDERGKIRGVGAEAVTEPGAEARPADDLMPGVHENLRRRMSQLLRENNGQVPLLGKPFGPHDQRLLDKFAELHTEEL